MTKLKDPELKSKWIAALRSGEYKQTQAELFNEEKQAYCCLGVLCKVIGAEFTDYDNDEEFHKNIPVLNGKPLVDDKYDESLSGSFADEIGLGEAQQTLIELNDGTGAEGDDGYKSAPQPFTVIADWIEENL